MIVLAGDVGGTRTRLGLFDIENRIFRRLAFERYDSKKFDNLGQIVQTFMKTIDVHPRAAAFGIAGPVMDGRVRTTNLPWKIDVAKLSKRIGIKRTTIVNNFVSNAYGISAMHRSDLATIQRGKHEGLANKALIGPGAGLGEAVVAQHGGDTLVVASEGGHKDFAPQGEIQIELLEFLTDKFGHVSYERICSKSGVVNVYEFMKRMKYVKESDEVKKALHTRGTDKPAIIMHFARSDKLCRMTANLLFAVLGAEAGNLALQSTAFGGVYLAGSLVRQNLDLLKKSPFLRRFNDKGRFSKMTKRIPVYVIKNEALGIIGSAALASGLF